MQQAIQKQTAHLYLIDDDPGYRYRLLQCFRPLAFKVTSFTTVKSFINWIDYESIPQPACILVEAALTELSGLDLLRVLKADSVTLPTIMMSRQPSIRTVVEAMLSGAVYFLDKSAGVDELATQLERIVSQYQILDDDELGRISARYNSLSTRQKQIFMRVFRGEINKTMAAQLQISIKTVELHRALMMKKMQANSIAQLIQMAVQLNRTHGRL